MLYFNTVCTYAILMISFLICETAVDCVEAQF